MKRDDTNMQFSNALARVSGTFRIFICSNNHSHTRREEKRIIIKTMLLFLLVLGIGFTAGCYCTYRGMLEEGLEGWMEEVELEDWL